MRLLLVEDDNHVAAALSAVLARHGFDVTHARSGEEALQALVPEGDGRWRIARPQRGPAAGDPRRSRAWRRLRDQVLREEPVC